MNCRSFTHYNRTNFLLHQNAKPISLSDWTRRKKGGQRFWVYCFHSVILIRWPMRQLIFYDPVSVCISTSLSLSRSLSLSACACMSVWGCMNSSLKAVKSMPFKWLKHKSLNMCFCYVILIWQFVRQLTLICYLFIKPDSLSTII